MDEALVVFELPLYLLTVNTLTKELNYYAYNKKGLSSCFILRYKSHRIIPIIIRLKDAYAILVVYLGRDS